MLRDIRTKFRRFRSRLPIRACSAMYGVLLKAGWRKKSEHPEKCTVILMNYKRPFNMECQLRLALSCDFVGEVLLSNNNPDCDLAGYVTTSDPRLTIIDQQRQRFPSVRFELAKLALFESIIAVDDDVFPTPGQLKNLFHSLLSDPSCPHGWGGECWKANLTESDDPTEETTKKMETCKDMEIDVLYWAFAFTKTINERYFRLLEEIGETNESVTASEDVVLSFAGNKSARIHATGKLIECPTSASENIATHQQSGFWRRRAQLVCRCREVTGMVTSATKQNIPYVA